MSLLPEELEQYTTAHCSELPEYLNELERETRLKVLMPQMISGKVQGTVLRMLVHMIQARRVLEIGTFTGYSALCMASAMPDDGKLITIDINEELEDMVRNYMAKAQLAHKITYLLGNALDIVPDLEESFDLVFIDADKVNYQHYYELVLPKVRQGGFIIADNVLWKGKVTSNEKLNNTGEAIRKFNEHVHNDERVENVLLAIRDGLMIARKL
ncbi:MAG: O-methyltransferase [Cyclobacteriaceae bacterium]